MNSKIGILGGVGPEATADLFKKLIRVTPAKVDQDHIETVIISSPSIPDRTQAILYGGENPVPALLKTAKSLEAFGVSAIIMPCNTAHYFYDELQSQLSIPILHMVWETVLHIQKNYPNVKKVGLLATTGTVKANIYAKELEKLGFEIVLPDEDVQENFVMEAIYGTKGIKAGFKKKPRTLLKYASMHLKDKGAELIIQGCTEIPLVLTKSHCEQPHVDPTRVIAMKAVQFVNLNILSKKTESVQPTEIIITTE